MNINFNSFFKLILPFLFISTVVYLLSTVLFFYLPKVSVELSKSETKDIKYTRYSFEKSYDLVKKQVINKPKPKKQIKKEYKLLSNLTLVAIFAEENGQGWITIEENQNKNTHFLSIGDMFKAYKLTKVYPSYAIFENRGREYKLTMKKEKTPKYEVVTKKADTGGWKEKIVSDGNTVKVKRNYLNKYVNNFDKIWKEIAIKEIYKNGVIDGFKVNNIKKGSAFEQLGLRRGDVIKAVNNVKLDSYKKAFKIYNDMNSINFLNIQILRNKQIMELDYEVN